MGTSTGGWEEAQVRRAQEVFWGILCSQKKENPTHPSGNDNCEGIADVPEVLTKSTLAPHRSALLHSHSSPTPGPPVLLLRASRTEVICPHFSTLLLGQSDTASDTLVLAHPRHHFSNG